VCEPVYRRAVKRLFDIVLGIIALLFVALEFVIVAPLIYREDRGTIFYNATRIGEGGKPFVMYKFRSMRMNAPVLKMEDGSAYNAADDPRQTRIGAFLRKTSLDELPQVLNVLKGDMSFIGPRPDLAEEVALYRGKENRKLEVRPGISGYAQVYGRNALAWRDRLALDVYYVEHLSFSLDARIFFKTFSVVLSQKGIYVNGEHGGGGYGDDEHGGGERGDGGEKPSHDEDASQKKPPHDTTHKGDDKGAGTRNV
jgi:lipopolysaccharide/colanic/teichoic acid biosynthesis glycosyltransferase